MKRKESVNVHPDLSDRELFDVHRTSNRDADRVRAVSVSSSVLPRCGHVRSGGGEEEQLLRPMTLQKVDRTRATCEPTAQGPTLRDFFFFFSRGYPEPHEDTAGGVDLNVHREATQYL